MRRLLLLLGLASLGFADPKAPTPPPITSVHVHKDAHTLELWAGDTLVKSYRVAIGSGGLGPKHYEGDGVTPTGTYQLKGRFSLYHQFINVTYPNADDIKRFAELKANGGVPAGRSVGFGIGLHGVGRPEWNKVHKDVDWTTGCIGVDDDEIDEISKLVKDGTTLEIQD